MRIDEDDCQIMNMLSTDGSWSFLVQHAPNAAEVLKHLDQLMHFATQIKLNNGSGG